MDSTADLNFNDYDGGKVVGTHDYVSDGNGLKNKNAKEIIIPETFLNVKVIEIGERSLRGTGIESVFVSKNIKSIRFCAFYECRSLKYITFDANSKLENLERTSSYFLCANRIHQFACFVEDCYECFVLLYFIT